MSADEREAEIRSLLPLVRAMARRVHRMVPMSSLDDLIGDGCVGAIRAVDAFDPSRCIPLHQYARRVILGAVLNGVRRMDPVSERMRRTMRRALVARYELAQELGEIPTMNAMSRISPGLDAARTEVHRRTPLSLDTTLPSGERLDLDHSADPQVIVGERFDRYLIREAVRQLPSRERRIVTSRYFADRPLREMIEPLGISPQRVSQLHLLALRRLRETLAAHA